MKKKFIKEAIGRLLCISIGVLFVFGIFYVSPYTVSADEKIYSLVTDDLKKDTTFDMSYYPVKENDYTIQVIQVAESTDKELFIYTYQPSGQTKNLTATSINISTTSEIEIQPRNYDLTLLNSDGTLYKYIVRDFTVKSLNTRYYAIPSIFRKFDGTLGDKEAAGDNTVDEVSFEVGKQWCFSEINGKPYCAVADIETILITDKFVGYVRLNGGYGIYTEKCDSHFVAFNTDRNIDKLIDADVAYVSQSYVYTFATGVGTRETYGDKENHTVTLSDADDVSYTGGGWFAPSYKWNRIQTVSEFLSGLENSANIYSGAIFNASVGTKLSDEEKSYFDGKKWVLRFAETQYYLSSGTSNVNERSTLVGEVTILRLKFVSNGVTYNLGVVDNKQTGNKDPIGSEDTKIDLTENGKKSLKTILLLLALILLVVILMPVLPGLVQIIVIVVSLPFKLIAGLIKGIARATEKSRRKRADKSITADRAEADIEYCKKCAGVQKAEKRGDRDCES